MQNVSTETNHAGEEAYGQKVLLIIPAYNEAENLPRVVEEIVSQHAGLDYVIVSDGSTDNTVALCRERGYHYIALPINLGLAGCFQTGMKYAYQKGYGAAIQFDGDGQHRAEDIPALKQKLQEGNFDIVLGSRFLLHKKGASMREIGSRLITAAIRLTTGQMVTDPTCGLRLYSRSVIDSFANRLNYGPEPDTISYLIKNGARIAEVPVKINDRTAGESYLRPAAAVRYMSRMLISILIIQNFRGARKCNE